LPEIDISEVFDGFCESFTKGYFRLPIEMFSSKINDRLALGGVVGGQGFENEFGTGADHFDGHFSKLSDGEFAGVSEVDGPVEIVRSVHHSNDAFNEIIDVAEGSGLGAGAVDSEVFAFECLPYEIGDDSTVEGVHARTVGIEDSDDADIELVHAEVVEAEGFCGAFAFVVAGAGSDGVDVSAV